MQSVFALLLVSMAAACWAQDQPIFTPKTWLKTVKNLDRSKYIGRWYQMYGNAFGRFTQGDSYCTIADYAAYNGSTISVRNWGKLDSADGDVSEIRGRAISTQEPGQFRLQLGAVSFEGTYWVLKLGPVVDGLYDYTVISSKGGLTLFVMVRDVDRLPLYDQEIKDFLNEQRFTDLATKPYKMYNGDDCEYPPRPENRMNPEDFDDLELY